MDRDAKNLHFSAKSAGGHMQSAAPAHSPVPTFFLYGEPRRSVSPRFLHLENLEERSRPTNWNIRPHAHADLHHIFLVASGAGTMKADGAAIAFISPCLLLVPARTVHSFVFEPETSGQVLTVAHSYLRRLLAQEEALASLFLRACVKAQAIAGIASRLETLAQELTWSAVGHTAAIDANLLLILVEVLRLAEQTIQPAQPAPGKAAQLVARFRHMVEISYRSGRSIEDMARTLSVQPAALRRACARVAGCAPVCIVQDRIFLEAQRLLLYTNMSISEAAAYLGFEDCAYFSRFFKRHAGCSPRGFRESRPSTGLV